MLKSQGWKGIAAGIALMVYAVVGVVLSQAGVETSISLSLNQAFVYFMEGLGILGIRVALNK